MSSIYIRQGRRRCRTMKVNFPRCLDCCRRICQLILFRRIFVVLKRKFKPIVSYCFLLQFNKHSVTSRSENFNDVGGKERWVDEDIFVYLFLLPIMTCDQTFVDGHVPVQPLNNGQFSSVRETFSLVRRNSSLPRWWASDISTTQRVQVCRDCSRRVGEEGKKYLVTIVICAKIQQLRTVVVRESNRKISHYLWYFRWLQSFSMPTRASSIMLLTFCFVWWNVDFFLCWQHLQEQHQREIWMNSEHDCLDCANIAIVNCVWFL